MLGEGYIEKVNEAVRRGIAADEAANPDEQYYHDELAFQTIAPDQSFYINDKEQVVVVFNKYAIAPRVYGDARIRRRIKIFCRGLRIWYSAA